VSDESSPLPERVGRLTELVELERAQIGSEIHDGLLPLIFAASASASSLLLDTSIDEGLRGRLQQIADWLAEAMATGRRMLTQIYPPELQGVPWSQAAKDALDRFLASASSQEHSASQQSSTPRLHWDLESELETASADLSLIAYRIVVEAVRNAIHHGKATDVSIRGRAEGDTWTIVIHDNGAGFDPDTIADDRFGIRSMRCRAALADGKLQIDSQPGRGTTVTVQLKRCE
jgi:signal transduction histidine kinase